MFAADGFMLVFRFVHIVAGVLWVGSAFLFAMFIGPAAAEVGPSAGPLLHVVVKKRKVAQVIEGLSGLTVLAGWIIWLRYVDRSGGLGNWLDSAFGLVLTIGGVLATIAFVVGWFGVGKNVERMVDLGDEIHATGGPPTPEQAGQMQRLGRTLETASEIDLLLLVTAVIAMATARYW